MFFKARPIFAKGRSEELHVLADFVCELDSLDDCKLHICAADYYRVFVDGKFVAFGPARTAKGYAREDIIDLGGYSRQGKSRVVISVMAHNCRCYATVHQRSYLLAEITKGDCPVAYTGRDFECFLPASHTQKTERYSLQRHFTEVWDLRKSESAKTEIEVFEECPTVLPRRAPYPYYEDVKASGCVSRGDLSFDETVTPKRDNYSNPKSIWGSFPREEIEHHPYEWIQCQAENMTGSVQELPLELACGQYAIFDLSRIETGFIMLSAHTYEDADIVIAFSEDASPERFQFTEMHTHNVLELFTAKGNSDSFISFEPYVMRYAIVALKSGSARIDGFGVKTYVGDVSSVVIPDIEDDALRSIYRAAVRTYSHNAVDIYMDCPSRERAGWLCDTYFTAKTEYALFGRTYVEDAFLENYRLFGGNEFLPKGVLPMAYPAEVFKNGKFIPQWTMWYIIEADDYVHNRGHKDDAHLFGDSINGLLEFYSQYENSDGLLEDLPSWNFVEWSKANEWTQNVSYPTNFLYAQTLECVSRLLGEPKYLEKANAIRKVAVEQSFDGKLFLDHAVRDENGVLERQEHCSEACQYYAILFAGIDINEEKYAELRRFVFEVFGAERSEPHPEIADINAFIGAYLRLEVLMNHKRYDLVLRDVKGLFGEMESVTGTLWEYRQRKGSRDHGFASYALVAIKTALEGI
ncbi:MAG: hypothetical protein E7653_07715 [Ruminococcaceae bacterium]|nr:hypothetical protein [Oscillospiraceae bacterium]